MDQNTFDTIVKNTCKKINDILVIKGKEYVIGNDRLHNFRVAARKLGTNVPSALVGMDAKHVVSIDDMVNHGLPAILYEDGELNTKKATVYIDEKIGDHINYTILLKAALLEKFKLI